MSKAQRIASIVMFCFTAILHFLAPALAPAQQSSYVVVNGGLFVVKGSSSIALAADQLVWYILKPNESSERYLKELFSLAPDIRTCADAAREFFRIVRARDLNAWPTWRESASHTPLASFARHLCRDEAAVRAALEYKWSNGPVEGNVHRLKLIKRSMYGRASFPLLRARVLSTE